MIFHDNEYLRVAREILDEGKQKGDRTGTGTISSFGKQMRFDLSKGFPLLTSKRVHFKSVVHELLWFLKGETDITYLKENGVTIWDEWADENGELGPVYGHQWRSWRVDDQYIPGVGLVPVEHDQIKEVIETLKTNPDSRRMIVSAWNVADIPEMALPPCHLLFQFYVEPLREGEERRRLSCQLYQRSADWFLGVPFNIASYALLTHMMAQVTGLDVGEFIWTGGDCHIYNDHIAQIEEQLTREPRASPSLFMSPGVNDIDNFLFEDILIVGYEPHKAIKGKVSV